MLYTHDILSHFKHIGCTVLQTHIQWKVCITVTVIFPGERYDFVLTANKEAGNYWIKIQGLGNCDNNGHAYAILHYNGFEGDSRPKNDPEDFSTQNGTVSYFGFISEVNTKFNKTIRTMQKD